MYSFNEAATKYLFPGIDPGVVISSRQFLTSHDLVKYFLVEVNDRFIGASENITEKPIFHKFNHSHPYIKVTTIQANISECGSISSNLKGRNEAAEKGVEATGEFIYPYTEQDCYTLVS